MQIRVQLIENNPLHRVPSIFMKVGNKQFIFNVIPTLTRHRNIHRLFLNRTSYIFFTKNSIDAMGGLPNYLLYRSGTEHSNEKIANDIYLYGNQQMVNYLQKLRFKIGYKAMRFSFTNWTKTKYRFGISSLPLFNKLKFDPQLPNLFVKIQQQLKKNYKPRDYYDSRTYLKTGITDNITLQGNYFNSQEVNIHPISAEIHGVRFTHYICTFPGKNGSILILHYSSINSVKYLLKNYILSNYFANNNKTALVVHIVQDKDIFRKIQFSNLLSKFEPETEHLWFGHQFNTRSEQDIVLNEQNIQEQKIWSDLFPNVMKNIYLNRMKYCSERKPQLVTELFPFLKNYIYKKAHNYARDEYEGLRYENRKVTEENFVRLKLLREKIQRNIAQIQQLQKITKNIAEETTFKPKVIFLGTNSSMPTIQRNTSGILASFSPESNILLDCGEETYQQMANHYSPQQFQDELLKTRVIFITHIHSDHNIGILNLISQRQRILRQRRQSSKLYLIIPFNVYNWYAEYNQSIENLSESCDVLFTQVIMSQSYEKEIDQELVRQSQRKNKNPDISTCNINSFEDQYFSQIETSVKTKNLVSRQMPSQKNTLQAFRQLLDSHHYEQFLPIRVIHCPQSFGIVIKHRKFKLSYSGDTRPSQRFRDSASNSDLMIHEATFNFEQGQKAERYKHSTVEEAVKIGCDSESKYLTLTHFNTLFKTPSTINSSTKYIKYFDEKTIFAMDHIEVPLQGENWLPKLSKLVSRLSQNRDKN